jgi:two-component system, OmpR family, KDP operon response regulator KdpE
LIGTFHPDLVLLDMNMQGMVVMAACKLIRADKDVAIIMLTVRDSEEDKILALDAGAEIL